MAVNLEALSMGFCLNYVELYNWGPFHKRVTHLEIDGENSLFLGLNGAGKSSACDAINTLLCSLNDIVYNQSAEAKKNERSLTSYVRGYWRNAVDENEGKKRVGLRGEGAVFTVILGNFICKSTEESITLVQVMGMQNDDLYPSRDFYVSTEPLNIRDNFLPYANDKRALRKHLKTLSTESFDSFDKYSAYFKRLFGIQSNKTLKLFSKTIAMKTVENITSFVKEFMLDKTEVESELNDLIDHFDDLNRTYLAMCKARDELLMLEPISKHGKDFSELELKIESLLKALESLAYFIAQKKLIKLKEELEALEEQRTLNAKKITQALQKIQDLEDLLREIDLDIQKNGGQRLQALEKDLRKAWDLKRKIQTNIAQCALLLKNFDKEVPETEEAFSKLLELMGELKENLLLSEQDLDESLTSSELNKRQFLTEQKAVKQELEALLKRKSNISLAQLRIRQELCENLGVSEEQLPFAGELLKVKDEAKDLWEGAIEQVLHGFALSLLVPPELYSKVTDYVWHHDLKSRLVYYKVPEKVPFEKVSLDPRSLVNKVEIKDRSKFYAFLMDKLQKRFNYTCCEYENDFEREVKALSPTGLIKDLSGRHEKDDRHDLHDRSRYVLGWTNADKIALLQQKAQVLAQNLQALELTLQNQKQLRQAYRNKLTAIAQIEILSFEDLDLPQVEAQIADLELEKEQLSKTSEIFDTLMQKRQETVSKLSVEKRHKDKLLMEEGSLENLQKTLLEEQNLAKTLVDSKEPPLKEQQDLLESLYLKKLPAKLTYQSFVTLENNLKAELDKRLLNLREQKEELGSTIVSYMLKFTQKYPVEAKDLNGQDPKSWSDFKKLEDEIREDKLPDFVETFERKLTDNTIIEVARFVQQLNEHCRNIESNLKFINELLYPVDYTAGHYIKLVARENKDIEIREFKAQLKMCTSNASLSHDNLQEAEAKFKQIYDLIARFKGGSATQNDDNKRWRNKVIDVRNWYTYAAWECIRDSDEVFDYNEDSSGKSGGQKEKLAYTILATSLAYQYGISSENSKQSFRLVMLDEAFARSSPESATYCLQIFSRLKLQLLIITPMLKQDIIEPFVQHVLYFRARDNISNATHFVISDYLTAKDLYRKIEKGEISTEERALYDRLQKFGTAKERILSLNET